MPKDVRKLMRNYQDEKETLSFNHEAKFKAKLSEAFPKKKTNNKLWYAAATVTILLAVNIFFWKKPSVQAPALSLSSISPEMKKIENYYTTAINYEMASLEVTPNNKALLDEYFEKLSKLDADYKRLNLELENKGINNQTINALITNLQIRLQLLIQLKDQVQELQFNQSNHEKNIL